MVQTKANMDKDELKHRQERKTARAREAESLQRSSLGRGLQESPTIKENRLRSKGNKKDESHADTTEDETDAPAKKQRKKKRKADAPKIQTKTKKRKKKNESSSSSDSDSDSGSDSDSEETATKLIPQLLELLKKDKTKRKKKKSKKEKKKRKKHKKDSEDEKVAQKFIQSASRKPTPCSTKRRDPVEAQLNAQKRAKGVRFGINTMSYMVLLPKNYDKNTKGNDRCGMCRLVELVRGANRHGGASRAGGE